MLLRLDHGDFRAYLRWRDGPRAAVRFDGGFDKPPRLKPH
jgi:hypothetical protein